MVMVACFATIVVVSASSFPCSTTVLSCGDPAAALVRVCAGDGSFEVIGAAVPLHSLIGVAPSLLLDGAWRSAALDSGHAGGLLPCGSARSRGTDALGQFTQLLLQWCPARMASAASATAPPAQWETVFRCYDDNGSSGGAVVAA